MSIRITAVKMEEILIEMEGKTDGSGYFIKDQGAAASR